MEKTKPIFQKYIFVCENVREKGEDCCALQGAKIRELLKQAVKDRGLSSTIRVSRSGCLDVCSEGPNVLVVPDYIWYKKVRESDIPKILDAVLGAENSQ